MLGRLVRLVRSRIAIKLTLTLVGFVGVALIVAGVYLDRALETFAVEALEARLATAARLAQDDIAALLREGAGALELQQRAVRDARATGARVTIIAPDGTVRADSDVEVADLGRVENHAQRPEVRAALAGSQGRDLRTSATVSRPLLYVAVPVEDGGRVLAVLRLALPLEVVTGSHRRLDRVMRIGGLVALAAAFGIGLFVARRVTRPVVEMQASARRMSEGELGLRAPAGSLDEIGALGRALNVMMARLQQQIEDLRQERAKATAILDGMVEGVIAVDAHEAVVLMNGRARAMLGARPGAVEGKPFQEVVRNAELHEIFRKAQAAGAAGGLRRELGLTRPAARTLEVNALPLRLGGEPAGVLMVLHDVTELRRLEQVRTEFVANVSHELRTPLTAIQGYLETLLGGGLEEPEQARKFLDIAFRHTERLGRLLGDLTDLSNIELGKVTLQTEVVRLDDVLDSVLAIIRRRADSGGVALRTDLPADLPAVRADHDRLAQILINLVDNAVKYTPRDGTVIIGARPLEGGRVEVVVADTGVGIPRADLPRITERFYRVDKARSRELGGTGLGLAIVKHLVLAHGGELRIESEEGRGTTVRFTLPAETPP
jgi:two-component system phosphate regulon sensor histidine kinase PhoR